jgi:hypothetical protein
MSAFLRVLLLVVAVASCKSQDQTCFDHGNAVTYLTKGCDAGDPEACALLAARNAPASPSSAASKPQDGGSGNDPTTSSADVDVSIEGHDEKLAHGVALIGTDGTLSVSIADQPFDGCSRGVIGGASPMVVNFDLPPGPGGRYFAGQPVGPHVVGFSLPGGHPKDSFALGPQTTKVSLEPFKAEKGSRVRGSIEFHSRSSPQQTRLASGDTNRYTYDGKGSFDLLLCKVPDKLPASAPDKADAAAVTGTVAGAPFTAKSALAFVFADDRSPKDGAFALHNVELYPDAGVTCATRTREKLSVDSGEIGGANTTAPVLNAPQPVSFSQDVSSSTARGGRKVSEAGLGSGWVSLDAIDLTDGGHVKGMMFVVGEGKQKKNQAKLGGHFDATVCVLKPAL